MPSSNLNSNDDAAVTKVKRFAADALRSFEAKASAALSATAASAKAISTTRDKSSSAAGLAECSKALQDFKSVVRQLQTRERDAAAEVEEVSRAKLRTMTDGAFAALDAVSCLNRKKKTKRAAGGAAGAGAGEYGGVGFDDDGLESSGDEGAQPAVQPVAKRGRRA